MRPRPLETENRILRHVAADDLRVSLGRAVSEMTDMPTTGELIGNKLDQMSADSQARRAALNEINQDLQEQEQLLLDDMESESGPEARAAIRKKLAEIYDERGNLRGDPIGDKAVEIGTYRTPEELTEKYGDLLEFEEAMSDEEAQLLYQNKKEETIRNAIINAGPKGFVPGVAKFGGGIVAMATDPVEVATMFIPVVGQAGKAAAVARFGRVGGAAVVGATEGFTGALLTEPLYYGLSRNQQLDYSMQEALLNVGAGLFLGGGIGTVAGVFSRKSFDGSTIEEMAAPTADVRADLEPLDLSPYRRLSEEEAQAMAKKAVDQTRRMYNITGGHITYELAVRQFATDQGVRADLVAPRAVARPQTLSEFIRARGGINDDDPTFRGELANLGIKGRAGYTNSKGNMVNGISNTATDTNLDGMAELAAEAGFISSRDTNELIARIADEQRGVFTFARADENQAEMWRAYHEGKSDFEAETELRQEIRTELETYGQKNLTDEEVALISERMARTGEMALDAAQAVSIKVEDVRAEMMARYAMEPENDKLADFKASERAELTSDEIEFDEALGREEAILAQMREDGDLTPEQIADLDEIAAIDERVDAYRDVTEAAATCVARA